MIKITYGLTGHHTYYVNSQQAVIFDLEGVTTLMRNLQKIIYVAVQVTSNRL